MSCENLTETPQVAILLATFNGEKFLGAQLESLLSQTYSNLKIYVSDDGSSDETLKILKKYSSEFDNIYYITNAARRGAAQNFLGLIVSNEIIADWHFLCDQDDIWMPEKVQASIEFVRAETSEPTLVGGTSLLLFGNGAVKKHLPPKLAYNSFRFGNSLAECFTSGNTMIFNESFKNELIKDQIDVNAIESHDWFLYQYATYKGFCIRWDPTPLIYYRQHDNNLLGVPRTFVSRLKRLLMLANGYWKRVLKSNLSALMLVTTPKKENALILNDFILTLGDNNFFSRKIKLFGDGRISRTSYFENIIFKFFL